MLIIDYNILNRQKDCKIFTIPLSAYWDKSSNFAKFTGICGKYTNKRARNIKFTWIFFTASAENIRVYLKYNKNAKDTTIDYVNNCNKFRIIICNHNNKEERPFPKHTRKRK